MWYAVIIFVSLIILFFAVKKIFRLSSMIVTMGEELVKKDDSLEEANAHFEMLESAISNEVISKMEEQKQPPPSGAYQALFQPTPKGGILSIYFCLDTGHVARWHYPSVEILEAEAARLLTTAQAVRDKKLEEAPMPFNVSVPGSQMVH
jgi:hypothetical protein